jgi:transposase InsO family protein
MRKSQRALPHSYTGLRALTNQLLRADNPSRHYGFAVSRTAATNTQMNLRNKEVSVDWAIINKENLPGEYNVFAVFYDMHIGLVHVEFQASRGQADEALLGYTQRYGLPSTITHDNAREFTDGNFAKICKEKGIIQRMSAPYTPNQNPAEKYMDVLVSGARSLLYTAGLNAPQFWKHAVEHRTYLPNIMALPGRCSPDELTTGKQPDLTYLKIFGCEVMSFVEKGKRTKFEPRADRGIYLGPSLLHSKDTYKI